ncbi:MAG TPA: hypothetical protein P5060_01690, partial [Candidatus Absconditabacterales bacterium]|nr:hypothetical protein [Candidatus Absconditabacterales bacterium]
SNNLSTIDLSGLSGLQSLNLGYNSLGGISNLLSCQNINRGDIRYNDLSSDWIDGHESFLSDHSIEYYPQNWQDVEISCDERGDLSITGGLFNQRPIYSGTLLVVDMDVSYSGENMTSGTIYVGVSSGFEIDNIPFADSLRSTVGVVYGGPGDPCYTDFVQGTGDYIAHIDTLLDTALSEYLDCDSYPGELCTIIIDPEMPPLPLAHSDEIIANSGMTSRNWILVDVFNIFGQQPGEEAMLQISSGMQQMIDIGIAPSSIISQVCVASMGKYDLNQCDILGGFFSGDLGLDLVPNCGAMVYTNSGDIVVSTGDNNEELIFGRYPYIPGGFDIDIFVTSESTKDMDIFNNSSTIHVDFQTGAGIDCINSGGNMTITHGDIEMVYISTGGSCNMMGGICIEGDMYEAGDDFAPLGHNEFYPDDTCTTPVLPIATDVEIVGDTTIGSNLLGSYDFVYYSGAASWIQVGESFSGSINNLVVENDIFYVILREGGKGDEISSVLKFLDDNWTQLGESFTGSINYLTVENSIPYIILREGEKGDEISSVLKFLDDNWTQ